MRSFAWLTTITLTPLFGALLIALLPREHQRRARGLGLMFSFAALAIAAGLCAAFIPAGDELQFVERRAWIPSLGVQYFLGIDGLGLLLVLLTALVVPFALLAGRKQDQNPAGFTALVLLLESGLFGTFTALNFFHWFIFWEISLVPAYFLIRLWGGDRRVEAANQFFLYTLAGSVTMLLSFLAIFQATRSFDFMDLARMSRSGELGRQLADNLAWSGLAPQGVATVLFWGIFFGFAVKVPLVPIHTWAPAAYAAAPTSATMLLAGLMSKMGVYGFLRILLPVFPDQMRAIATPLLWLAVGSIVFSAFAALAQRDLKRMLAYSSINHLGYCLLGIFAVLRPGGGAPYPSTERAAALNGVLVQLFNHGLIISALFCFIGWLEARTGRRGLEEFGGLRQVAPVFCGLMGIAVFASLGLPGLNGFIGEFLIFKGAFALVSWATALSVIGLLVTAVFLLNVMDRVFHGPLASQWAGFADLTASERAMVAPVIGLMFLIGIYPQALVGFINSTVVRWVAQLG